MLSIVPFLHHQEICQSPAFFPKQISLGHAKQGLLGDCWLLCACTILLENKHLLNKVKCLFLTILCCEISKVCLDFLSIVQVIPPDQPLWGDSGYRGFFHFCFWQYGHWTDVIIDDFLPCVNSKLCFSRCLSSTAFWVALLEKAFAK